jgi:MoCo/4Fe-4S cofactor protein with predicted Tat translocation signal
MKIKINHPEPSAREAAGPRYWRSLGDLSATPAFKEWVNREFPDGATMLDSSSRRGFLKIMAASIGLAGVGLSGCRQQTRHLLPYSKQPERIIPGVPIFYTSSLPGAEEHVPLIVETHDARPTKIEGNPSYLPYGGSTNVYAQSSVLDLYDADRAQRSSAGDGTALSPAQVMDRLNALAAKYSSSGGAGLYFLADKNTSPTRARIVQRLRARFPQAVWAEYEPLDQANPERAATAYAAADPSLAGRAVRAVYNFAKARRVLALDSDFLHTDPGHLGYARGFADARRLKNGTDADPEKMIRLYTVESNFSLTGANADHRLRCATSHVWGLAALIAAQVFTQLKSDRYAGAIAQLQKMGAGIDADVKWISECAKDLVAHAGSSAVIAGPHLPVGLHQLVLLMNEALGALGATVNLMALPSRPDTASIAQVAQDIDAKKVQTLFILNGNPAYNAPSDLNFADKLKAVPEVIRHGYYGRSADDTSVLAGTFIAGLHYLESWGDGLTWDGVHVPVQPMIFPLFEGFGELDVLGQLAGDANPDAYAYVRDTFTTTHPHASFDEWLAIGVAGAGFAAVSASVPDSAVAALLAADQFTSPTVDENNLEARFIPGAGWDGRYANNGWLQECPDPMSKLTWGNAIFVSPRLGKQLGLWPKVPLMAEVGQAVMNANTFEDSREKSRIAEVTVNGQTIRGPVSILPGLANWTLVLPVGYGRRKVGHVGEGVGFSAYPLIKSSGTMTGSVVGAKITLTDDGEDLANVQEHWSMEGRALIRESNVTEYQAHPDFVKDMGVESHSPPIYGPAKDWSEQDKVTQIPRGEEIYQTHPNNVPAPNYPVWNTPEGLAAFPTPQQWGMSIDLNTCLGCTACIVACQAENNIPVVGKDQVMRGREMHWIRLDRYFSTGPGPNGQKPTEELPEDPQVSFQSMACQQCELAPCENVCPFMATLHDDQGLNVMAYNRCAGTKYCANNCPYKVRRFNFFDWNKREVGKFYQGPLGPDYYDTDASQLTRMQKNPDVTIRMRGVMEKCTYCVQRIESAKINQRIKAQDTANIKVPDGTIQPACAQACPTNSIVFGDVSDAASAVSEAKNLDRNYAVLGYLDTRPRTTYLAKIRNPNPAMPDFAAQPLSRLEYEMRYGRKTEGDATAAPVKTS